MTLTIYSDDYDNYSYVAGNGMNNHIFLEENGHGLPCKNVQFALNYVVSNNLKLDEIVYCYQNNGIQKFKKLKIVE